MAIFRIIGLWLKRVELTLKQEIQWMESTASKEYADLKAEIKKL